MCRLVAQSTHTALGMSQRINTSTRVTQQRGRGQICAVTVRCNFVPFSTSVFSPADVLNIGTLQVTSYFIVIHLFERHLRVCMEERKVVPSGLQGAHTEVWTLSFQEVRCLLRLPLASEGTCWRRWIHQWALRYSWQPLLCGSGCLSDIELSFTKKIWLTGPCCWWDRPSILPISHISPKVQGKERAENTRSGWE